MGQAGKIEKKPALFRIFAIPLVLGLVFGPSYSWADSNCTNWGGNHNGYTNLSDCLNAGRDDSRNRGDDAQRRGADDQQRSREAGLVADRLDRDKGSATSRYANPGMSQTQRAQLDQQPYRLSTPYAEKYHELSRYLETSRSTSLPKLPDSNGKLRRFDTAPLRDLQKDRQDSAENLFKQAQQAMAAAQNFQRLAQVSQTRGQGLGSVPSAGAAPMIRAGKGLSGTGSEGLVARGEGAGVKPGLGRGSQSEGSTISRRIDSFVPGGAAKKQITAVQETKGKGPLNGKAHKDSPETDAASAALAKMDAAKKGLLDQLAAGERDQAGTPKTAVESFLDEVAKPGAGRAPASEASATSAEGGVTELGALAAAANIATPVSEGVSTTLAAPAQLLESETIFTQVSRQYQKRRAQLVDARTGKAMVAGLGQEK